MGSHLSHPNLRLRALIPIALGIAVFTVSCGGDSAPIGSPITEEEAVEMAENALSAFNSGDYAAWSRDWSDAMKAAIDEEAFQSFRSQYHAELGDYVAINEVTGAPGNDSGTYRWTYDVRFSNMDYTVWFGFRDGSEQIEGVSFEEPAT